MPFALCLLLSLSLLLFGCKNQPYPQGQSLYKYHCENCHMEDGSGLAKLIPPLEASRLTLSDPAKLVCLVRKGLPVNASTGQKMPANTALNDVEMTNLINFLGSKYASNPQTVQVQEVKKWMTECPLN